MLDELAEIHDNYGQLTGVTYALFEGDPKFITAVGLRFESISAIFRAVADDDTLAVIIDTLKPESDETLIESNCFSPWSECIGLEILWAWQLTNQQGYSDGVRLEFNNRLSVPSITVEMIVAASAIRLYTSVPSDIA